MKKMQLDDMELAMVAGGDNDAVDNDAVIPVEYWVTVGAWPMSRTYYTFFE